MFQDKRFFPFFFQTAHLGVLQYNDWRYDLKGKCAVTQAAMVLKFFSWLNLKLIIFLPSERVSSNLSGKNRGTVPPCPRAPSLPVT